MYKIIGADGKEYGPISAEGLRQWIAEGRANAQTKVQVEGSAEWKRLEELPEFSTGPAGNPFGDLRSLLLRAAFQRCWDCLFPRRPDANPQ